VYVPEVNGAVNPVAKLPAESEVTEANTVEPIAMVIVDSGAKPVPLTVTLAPRSQVLGERDIVGVKALLWTTTLPPPSTTPVEYPGVAWNTVPDWLRSCME